MNTQNWSFPNYFSIIFFWMPFKNNIGKLLKLKKKILSVNLFQLKVKVHMTQLYMYKERENLLCERLCERFPDEWDKFFWKFLKFSARKEHFNICLIFLFCHHNLLFCNS